MKRNIHGIFLLDKPLGGSSNHALQQVKRLFNASKAGHTGSLDPLATGMLPICLGEATKYSQHLLDADKCYEVTAQLGIRTETGDSEGRFIDMSGNLLLDDSSVYLASLDSARLMPADIDIEQMLQKFTGEIQQIPPMYSALKYKGRPLYEYARNGETIERAARTVRIYTIELINRGWVAHAHPGQSGCGTVNLPTISLRVHCSKGTYIRSLIDDIGQGLGCGAHVTALRRIWVEPFQVLPMLTLSELEAATDRDQYLLSVDAALTEWPQQILTETQAQRLLQGLPVFVADAPSAYVRFYTERQLFLGVGFIAMNGEVVNKRLSNLHSFSSLTACR